MDDDYLFGFWLMEILIAIFGEPDDEEVSNQTRVSV